MLLLLHSINGLLTQKVDKKVQMYAHESNRQKQLIPALISYIK